MLGFLDHIVLNIEHEEAVLDFYTKILMLPAERIDDYRDGKAPFPSVRINENTVIDLFPKKLWDHDSSTGKGFSNLNHFCLSLTKKDWEDLYQRLGAHKISIREGPVQRWGARGSGTSIYFSDPEGNMMEARFYEQSNQPEKCLLGS